MDMCIGTLSTQRGSFKAKYYRKLTRCVKVMYPPYVDSKFHTPPLYTCRNIHCTFEGLDGQSITSFTWQLIKHGFLFNSESVTCVYSCTRACHSYRSPVTKVKL